MMSRLVKAASEGLVAGLAMAMLAMGAMLVRGKSPLEPVKLMAGTFEGATAEKGGWGAALLGAMIHMTMSSLFGVLFRSILGLLDWRGSPPLPVVGTLYALGIWAVNEFATLPVVDPLMARRIPKGLLALSHVVYGMALGALGSHLGPQSESRQAQGEAVRSA